MKRGDSPPPQPPAHAEALPCVLLANPSARATFDRLARLASKCLRAPMAEVTLASGGQQVSVSRVAPAGCEDPARVPLSRACCEHVVATGEPLLVGCARERAGTPAHSRVGSSEVAAFAAAPLTMDERVLGTLCVADHTSREWDDEDIGILASLADLAAGEIQRRSHAEAEFQHLSAVLESADDAVVGVDVEGTICIWNRAAAGLFALPLAEALGRNVRMLIPDECKDELTSVIERAHAGEETQRFATERLRADGQRVPVSVVVTPTRDLVGRIVGMTAVIHDLSLHAELVNALQESEARFRQLAENINMVFWLRDTVTDRLLYVSPAYERIWGEPPQSLRRNPKAWAEALHPDDAERVLADVHARASAEYEIEYRIVRPDGEVRWVRDRGFPIRDPAGAVVRTAGIAEDITERRAAEEALHASESRFRALIEHNTEIISVLDADLHVRYASPALHCVLGYTPDEWIGENACDLIHPDDRARAAAHFTRLVEEAVPLSAEFRARHRDGTYRILSSTGLSLLDDPAVAGVVVNTRDVTQLRDGEHRIRQVQKMEALGRLAGGIAHDFNNVLMAIKGTAGLAMLDVPAETPLHHDLVEIDDAVNRAANLTRQLLSFSRHQVVERRVIDLNAVVGEMQRMLGRTIGADIEFTLRLDPHLVPTEADPCQIEQILLNLVLNARDAMPSGGTLTIATTTVRLSQEDVRALDDEVAPGTYAVLTVSDSGSGIPRGVQERIFEPFFTTKKPGEGTGLGLSTVYGIVTQSGGCIRVHSAEGRGTTFKLYFPGAGAQRPMDVGPPPDPDPRSATILLVEDDPRVRSVTRRILQRLGYRVLEATDGEEACSLADDHGGEIDLLLTDIVMPRTGGRALAEKLTARFPALRVLYTSGYAGEDMARDLDLDGQAAFLQKPYDTPALAKKVADLLNRPHRTA